MTCHVWAMTDGASDVTCGAMGDTRGAYGDGGMQATGMETEGPTAKGAEGVAFEDDMDGAGPMGCQGVQGHEHPKSPGHVQPGMGCLWGPKPWVAPGPGRCMGGCEGHMGPRGACRPRHVA